MLDINLEMVLIYNYLQPFNSILSDKHSPTRQLSNNGRGM